MPPTQKHRFVSINTPLGEDALAIGSLRVEESLGRPFRIDVDLTSESGSVSFEEILGKNATIRLEVSGEKTRYFNGLVHRFVQTRMEGRHAHYRATLVPWLWFLTRTADCRIFQKMKAPDILKQVFRDHGFSDFRDALTGSYFVWEYCVQYRETDFNFVSRLMEQEGIYYFFEHENGRHTLVLADGRNAHKPFPGYARVDYRGAEGGVREKEYIFDWTTIKEVHAGVYSLNEFNFETPKSSLLAKSRMARAHALSEFEIYDYPGEYDEQGEAEGHYAKVRLQELQSRYEVAQGHANARGIAAGSVFSLDDYPRPDQNRDYLVTDAVIRVTGDDYVAGSGSGEDFFSCAFSAVPSDTLYRPARTTPKPLIQGPQTAIVAGPKGEEIYTDKYGRVKLQFHWDRYGKADEQSSCWVRVSQEWAGKKWGSMHIPRIGQEVIVEFLEGDPDCPIITGRVYNADAMPPYALPEEKTKSTLKSNSTKGGDGFNEIRFEDKKGSEQIFIHGQKDLDVRVRNDVRETNYGNRDVRVGWEKDGAKGGSFNTLVRHNVNNHVEGSQYERVEKELHQTVEKDVIEYFQKNQSTLVTDVRTLNAREIVVEAGDAISQKTVKLTVEASSEIGVKGGAINVESSKGISLKCGGSFITINPSGVAIHGATVLINSGGAAMPAAECKPADVPPIELPRTPRIADDAKTGSILTVRHTAAQRQKVKPPPIKAAPFVPLKPKAASSASSGSSGASSSGPEAEVASPPRCAPTKPCDIVDLKLYCGDRGEPYAVTSQKGTVLQVVPSKGVKKVCDSVKYFGLVECSRTKTSGGVDDVTAVVVSQDGQAAGRKEICFKRSASPPGESEWVSAQRKTEQIKSTPSEAAWLADVTPEEYSIFGRGCVDGSERNLTLQVFPSEQYELKIAVTLFKKYYDQWNMYIKLFAGATFGAVEITQKMKPPEGVITVNTGWKEEKNKPLAYYDVEVLAGLDPWWGGSIEISVSILTLVATCASPLAVVLARVAKKLVDGYVSVEVGISTSLKAGWHGKQYYLESFQNSGEFKITGKGEIVLTIGVKANLWVLEVRLEGKATTELEIAGTLEGSARGLEVDGSFTYGEIKIKFVTVWSAYDAEEKDLDDDGAAKTGKEYTLRPKDEVPFGPWPLIEIEPKARSSGSW